MKILFQFLIAIYIFFTVNIVNANIVLNNTQDKAQVKTLVFGVVPQQSATKLATIWIPLLQFVSEKSGVNLKFATAPDIPTFERRLANGDYDIAYMNPYHYVVLNKEVGFKALVHEKDKRIKGVIVANKNSVIDKLEDLSEETIAFPAPASFAATLIPKANLIKKDINFNYQYVNSHDAVYRNIAEGRFVAGGGIIRTFNALPESVRNELKIIWTSDNYTPHAIATYPSVNEATRQKLVAAFLAVENAEHRVELLAPLAMKGFVKANCDDWDDVRDLNINFLLGQQ
ncbi:phosphate/phosphite/phosphonate ABC transporter substrate-binding protein [uncultured Psychromonas sp.]|uniref:phosphate/phosphite/phosphonate ABC transporter substrate-binding protein n=1 Tax=uncultured Psychromonas sp. TaxID=173974 RepID=UPI00261333BA|nr:phosphate/phosphite/phosphonate ABC transporter substrate-binding protein [uncultured Psychromonas sp.]